MTRLERYACERRQEFGDFIGPLRACEIEFGDHPDVPDHVDCERMLGDMSSVDPAHDWFFEHDDYAHFERFGRPALPNEY
jgi:hypothetical protein